MLSFLQNDTPTLHLYVVDSLSAPVTGLKDTDLVVRAVRDGVYLGLVLVTSLQEVHSVDEPGLYYLTLPSSLTASPATLYLTIRPVVANHFEDLRKEFRVEAPFQSDVLDLLSRLLGLSQSNYRMDQQVYDVQGQLVQARLQTFANAADTAANLNPQHSYQLSAVYDTNGRLTDYQVVQL